MAAYSKSVQFTQGDPAAQAYELARQQQLVQALQAQSMQPIESASPTAPISWTQGLAKLLEGYSAGHGAQKVKDLLAAKDAATTQANQATLGSLLPDHGPTVGGVDEQNPAFQLQSGMQMLGPDGQQSAPSQQAQQLGSALNSALGPEGESQYLAQTMGGRMFPPVQQPFDLSKGARRFGPQGQLIAENPDKVPLEHVSRPLANDMQQEGTFNKDTGEYKWGEPHKGHEPVGSQPLPAVAADKGAVGMVLTGMPINQAIPGYGRQASAERKAARDGAISQLVIDHPGWSEMDAGTELAKRAIDFAGGKGAGVQTTKQLAANQNFLGTMDKNIANADALSKEVGGDTSPAMNKLFNMWKRGVTGDPKVRQLDIYNNEIQGEAAKLASGGVGSVSATSDTQIAKQVVLLQTADNYAAWRAAAQALQASGGNRISSILETIKSSREAVPGSVPTGTPGATPAAGAVSLNDYLKSKGY